MGEFLMPDKFSFSNYSPDSLQEENSVELLKKNTDTSNKLIDKPREV